MAVPSACLSPRTDPTLSCLHPQEGTTPACPSSPDRVEGEGQAAPGDLSPPWPCCRERRSPPHWGEGRSRASLPWLFWSLLIPSPCWGFGGGTEENPPGLTPPPRDGQLRGLRVTWGFAFKGKKSRQNILPRTIFFRKENHEAPSRRPCAARPRAALPFSWVAGVQALRFSVPFWLCSQFPAFLLPAHKSVFVSHRT